MSESGDSKKPDDISETSLQKDREEGGSSKNQSSIPEPASNSAVKEALEVAQSVGRQKSKMDVDNFGVGGLDDSVSLYEYIDDAERRSQSWFDSPASEERPPVEDLDVLNIAAEFGRPDEISDDSEGEYGEMGGAIETSFEDTKNLKLPSKPPSPPTPESDVGVAEAASSQNEIKQEESTPEPEAKSEILTPSPEITDREADLDVDEHVGRDKEIRRGRLETLRLWQLLAGIRQSRFRGICTLRSMGETRNLIIHDGDVLSATTSSVDKDFLSLLERERYLTKEDVVSIRQKAKGTPSVTVRDLLVSCGLIRLNAINRLERLHFEMLTMEAMGWTNGDFRLEALSSIPDLPISPIETPMTALIFRGFVDYASQSDAARFVQDIHVILKALSSPLVFSEELLLTDEETSFVCAFGLETTIEDAAASANLDFDKALRISAALLMLEFVAIRKIPKEEYLRISKPAATPPEQYSTSKVEKIEKAASPLGSVGEETDDVLSLKVKLAAKWKNIEKGTYFEILDLDPCVDAAVVSAAKDRLLHFFDVRRFARAGLPQTEEQVAAVRVAVEEAFLVLSDPLRCESYAAAVLDAKARHA